MASPELEAFIDESIRLSREHGYHPTVFIGMRQRYGTVPAISRLVQSPELQSGFRRMKELGLVELTVEAAVLKFPEEFSADAQQCAKWRIESEGV